MFSIVTATMHLELDEMDRVLAFYDGCHEAGLPFELVIQDNGSGDEVIETLRSRDYVKVVSEPDGGIYDAWNRALTRVSGDWVGFLGIDDLPTLDWVSFVSVFPPADKVSALACDVSMEDENHERIGSSRIPVPGLSIPRATSLPTPASPSPAAPFPDAGFPRNTGSSETWFSIPSSSTSPSSATLMLSAYLWS